MSSEAYNPEEAWRRLRAGKHEAHGISIPTIVSEVTTVDGAVRHALGAQGEARLLVPIGMHEKLKTFPESPALRVSDATYQQDGRPVRFLDLSCMVSELDSVFSEVGEELLKRIRDGMPAQSAVRSTLQDFRALLLSPSTREVSDSEITGLVGELLLLCRLLHLSPDAVEAWRGPAGERHDFRRGGRALEVKTTGRKSDHSVSISAIDQLDPPAGGALYLVQIILERDVSGPLTVGSLATLARSLASEPGQLEDLLTLCGCHDPEAENWNRLSFAEEALTFFEVRDGFPRITPSSFRSASLPDGITKVEYTIDLSQAAEFALSDQQSDKIQRDIAG